MEKVHFSLSFNYEAYSSIGFDNSDIKTMVSLRNIETFYLKGTSELSPFSSHCAHMLLTAEKGYAEQMKRDFCVCRRNVPQ